MIHASSLASPNIRHAFFTRAGGVSSGIYESLNGGIGSKDAPENVRENRARMATALGVAPTHLVSCYQIHSPDVIVATEPWTRENSAAGRRDRDASARALRSGSARPTAARSCSPTRRPASSARRMPAGKARSPACSRRPLRQWKSSAPRAQRIHAAIGPLIRQPNYEVGPEFVQRFVTEDDANGRFFVNAARIGYAMFDLPGYIRSRLERAEIASIEDLGLCTYADPARFFSYRRTTHRGEPDYGRHVNAIALVK